MANPELKIGIGADTTELKKALEITEDQLANFANNIGKLGEKFKTLGNQLSVGLTLPIAGFATMSLKSNKEVANSFGALESSIKTAMGKVGDILENNLNISGIIDEVNQAISSLTAKFESLSPTMQKVIFAIGAVVAGIGPLIAVVGTVMTMLPTLLAGLGALSFALTAMVSPIGLVVISLAGLTAGYLALRDNTKTATDYQNEWSVALNKANAEAGTQVSALDALYKKTQDTTLSLNERRKAVDELQRLYPNYFQNIKDETILNGKAEDSYTSLRVAIVNASKARAAGAILDKRSGELLISQEERKLEIQKQLNRVYALQDAQKRGEKTYTVKYDEISTGYSGTVFIDEQLKIQKEKANKLVQAYQAEYRDYLNANKSLIEIQKKGQQDIANTTAEAPDVIIPEIKNASAKINTAVASIKINAPKIEPIDMTALTADFEQTYNQVKNWQTTLQDLYYGTAEAINNAKPAILTAMSNAQIAFEKQRLLVKQTFENLATDIENAIGSAIGDTVTDAFSAIGEALGAGGNVMASIGQSLLNSFSGFLKDMGKMMAKYGGLLIAYGIAEKVMKFSADPVSKIGAGIALVAIGGAMSLVGGAIQGASSGGSSGGGSYSTSSGNSSQSYSSSFSSGGGSGGGEVVFRISGNDLVGVLSRQQDKNTRLGD